jgi:ribosomal protein L16 Arg81 hydroxylase
LKGATLVVDSVNQIDPIVSRFANLLSRDLNTHVNVNCYASFPNKQGFDIHYDRHDVFIIQVSGSKVWKVFEPTIQWPLERQQRKETEPNDEEPYLDCTLTQGDVLYIPRGHWHYALADDPSIHLTAGPQSRSPIDFMSWLVGHLMENEPELRQDFPIVDSELLGGTRPDAELDDCFERVKNKLDTVFKTETIRELFKEYCLTSNGLRRHFNLPDFSLLNDLITEDMVFSLADEQKSLVDYKEEDQQARILMRGNMIYLGPLPREALELIFSGKSTITGKAILEACTELNWEQVKVVLLELHKHGVILI